MIPENPDQKIIGYKEITPKTPIPPLQDPPNVNPGFLGPLRPFVRGQESEETDPVIKSECGSRL